MGVAVAAVLLLAAPFMVWDNDGRLGKWVISTAKACSGLFPFYSLPRAGGKGFVPTGDAGLLFGLRTRENAEGPVGCCRRAWLFADSESREELSLTGVAAAGGQLPAQAGPGQAAGHDPAVLAYHFPGLDLLIFPPGSGGRRAGQTMSGDRLRGLRVTGIGGLWQPVGAGAVGGFLSVPVKLGQGGRRGCLPSGVGFGAEQRGQGGQGGELPAWGDGDSGLIGAAAEFSSTAMRVSSSRFILAWYSS